MQDWYNVTRRTEFFARAPYLRAGKRSYAQPRSNELFPVRYIDLVLFFLFQHAGNSNYVFEF